METDAPLLLARCRQSKTGTVLWRTRQGLTYSGLQFAQPNLQFLVQQGDPVAPPATQIVWRFSGEELMLRVISREYTVGQLSLSIGQHEMRRIREASENELDTVLDVVRAAIRHMESRGIYQWDEIYPDRVTLQRDIEKRHMQVIEVEGQVAGLVSINQEQPPEYQNVSWRYQGRAMVIHRLTIHPDHQRQGLANQMMEFAERMAEKHGYDTIRLDAFTQNPEAAGLYEHLGYEKAGTVRFRKGDFFCFEKPINCRR
jgi:ribosomal protein S18 acetylase RimI-like enzyme